MSYIDIVTDIMTQIPDYITHCPALPVAAGLCIVGAVIWLFWEVVEF